MFALAGTNLMRTHTTSNETVEMYLKTIAELSDGDAPVVIARVAERLGVTAVSANEMMKRLVEQGYLDHQRYKGVVLTEHGRYVAHTVMRRQRLWECFLVDHLKFNWSGAYEAACRLEHATSNVLTESLDAYLGHPVVCPHGNPIPDSEGHMPQIKSRPLSALRIGETAVILSIKPASTDIFAYLSRNQIVPGQHVSVVDRAPMEGPMTLRLENTQVAVSLALASSIMVMPEVESKL